MFFLITLIKIQQKNLAEILVKYPNVKVEWYNNFQEISQKPMIFIANEFFDALPVQQYVKKSERWQEKIIVSDSDNDFSEALSFSYREIDDIMAKKLSDKYPYAEEI